QPQVNGVAVSGSAMDTIMRLHSPARQSNQVHTFCAPREWRAGILPGRQSVPAITARIEIVCRCLSDTSRLHRNELPAGTTVSTCFAGLSDRSGQTPVSPSA